MREAYTGKVGSENGMSALAPEFQSAYAEAVATLMAAVVKFERTTSRTVDAISLTNVDLTTILSTDRELVRTASLHFLPKSSEVSWPVLKGGTAPELRKSVAKLRRQVAKDMKIFAKALR